MASLNTTSFTTALKIIYPDSLEEVWFPQSPFMAWVPKSYDFEGASKQSNAIYSGTRGSAKFSTAINAKSTPSFAKFNVTRKKDYAIGSIDNEAILASASNRGAIAKAIKVQVDAAGYEFGRSMAFQAWSDGSGQRGKVSSYAAGVITLTERRDTVYFEVGMVLEKKNNAGTLLGGEMTVDAVNIDSGTVTVTLTGGAADPAANDRLGRSGDFNTGANNSDCFSGVFAWIPVTAPTSTLFYGVDRSLHTTRLGGGRMTGGAKIIEEIVFDALARLRTNGGTADTLWMNSERAAELQKSMQAKAFVDVMSEGKAKIGLKGFTIVTTSGPITVMDDPNCPYAYGLITKRDCWDFSTLGDCPHFAEEDGRRFLRESSSDGVEFRLKYYGNLICQAPVNNMLVDFDT